MKVTIEQALELLKVAGVQAVEVVEDSTQSTFDKDEALTLIDNSRSQVIKPKIEAELKGDITNTVMGKLHGSLNSVLAQNTGASRSEIDRITDISERVKFAIEHKAKQLEGSQVEIDNRFNEVINKHNQEVEALKGEYEAKVAEANNKYIQRDIQNYLATKLGDAPLPKETDRLIAANDFQKHLADKYHVSYDEAGKMVKLYDKQNPQTMALNDKGTNPVDIMSEAETYFKPRGLWHTDMRNKNAKEELNKMSPEYIKQVREERAKPKDPVEKASENMRSYLEAKTAEAQ